jgi:hypothetical protein
MLDFGDRILAFLPIEAKNPVIDIDVGTLRPLLALVAVCVLVVLVALDGTRTSEG